MRRRPAAGVRTLRDRQRTEAHKRRASAHAAATLRRIFRAGRMGCIAQEVANFVQAYLRKQARVVPASLLHKVALAPGAVLSLSSVALKNAQDCASESSGHTGATDAVPDLVGRYRFARLFK